MFSSSATLYQTAETCYSLCKNTSSDGALAFSWLGDCLAHPQDYYMEHCACAGENKDAGVYEHREEEAHAAGEAVCFLLNGRFLSSSLPEGVFALPLSEAEALAPLMRTFHEDHPLAWLNAEMAQGEGVAIYIPEQQGSEAQDVVRFSLIHRVVASDPRIPVCAPKVFLILGKGVQVELLVCHRSSCRRGIVNGVTEAVIAEGASLQVRMIPEYDSQEVCCWSHVVTVEKNGQFLLSQDVRNQQGIGIFENTLSLVGEAAHGSASVAAYNPEKTWVKNQVVHDAEETTSRQKIRSIVTDGKFFFEGGIHITPKGQKTDAYQKHDALILGEQGSVSTYPRLHILADDVKASHGATVGALDPQQIRYLCSRGISYEEAQALLIQGFLQEALL